MTTETELGEDEQRILMTFVNANPDSFTTASRIADEVNKVSPEPSIEALHNRIDQAAEGMVASGYLRSHKSFGTTYYKPTEKGLRWIDKNRPAHASASAPPSHPVAKRKRTPDKTLSVGDRGILTIEDYGHRRFLTYRVPENDVDWSHEYFTDQPNGLTLFMNVLSAVIPQKRTRHD